MGRLRRDPLEGRFVGEPSRRRRAGDVPVDLTVSAEDRGVVGEAEVHRAPDDRAEHDRDVGGRLAHRLQHLADRNLALERVAGLRREAGVVDRDRGLVGERADERDLALGERPHLRSDERQDADHGVAAEKRDPQGAVVAELGRVLPEVVGIRLDGRVPDVKDSLALEGVFHDVGALDGKGLPNPFHEIAELLGWLGRPGHEVERVAVDEEQAPVAPRIAELSGALHHRVEHGLKVRRGPAHHREHLGERGFARPRRGEVPLQVHCSAQPSPSRVRQS